jgi:hypothetical protein
LLSMSKVIGTKNPITARIVCYVGLVQCTAAGAGMVFVIIGCFVMEGRGTH